MEIATATGMTVVFGCEGKVAGGAGYASIPEPSNLHETALILMKTDARCWIPQLIACTFSPAPAITLDPKTMPGGSIVRSSVTDWLNSTTKLLITLTALTDAVFKAVKEFPSAAFVTVIVWGLKLRISIFT